MRSLCLSLFLAFFAAATAQDYRWQQRVEYKMDVKLDVKTHRVQGKQTLTYYNESNDTLRTVYYHLYFNAFQPNSMMDVRSRSIADPDGRVTDRISKLSEKETGYQKISTLTQDGKEVTWSVDGTVMEVTLAKPMMPKSKTTFDMTFESQVPLQIRRSGRDNKEGISYSMTQWYPKLAEYDHQGWHINPYVAREFHGVWGDYDVNITIDPTYVIGGTGKLQNPEAIGHGYEKKGTSVKKSNSDLTWHFVAKNVHDFAWAADPDYAHDIALVPNGPELHFFYQNTEKLKTVWKPLQGIAVKTFQLMNQKFGKYPFDTYSIIQGGDGGMEYPMCTLILGSAATMKAAAPGADGDMIEGDNPYASFVAAARARAQALAAASTAPFSVHPTHVQIPAFQKVPLKIVYTPVHSAVHKGFSSSLQTGTDLHNYTAVIEFAAETKRVSRLPLKGKCVYNVAELSPSLLHFADTATSKVHQLQFSMKNRAKALPLWFCIRSLPAFFHVQPKHGTIPAEATAAFDISYKPKSLGMHHGKVHVSVHTEHGRLVEQHTYSSCTW
ncbi:MAG: M1 family metallopeptidase [Bacteroidia bacterium]|nr:M1 family metallopeptidase [Bacteroidia bacterium]